MTLYSFPLFFLFTGKEIKDDVMKMLQNKLDDALLDTICMMLSRNPQCKLKPDDISVSVHAANEAVDTELHALCKKVDDILKLDFMRSHKNMLLMIDYL